MKTKNLITEWLEVYQKGRVKKQTYNRYKSIIELHLVPILGELDISELSRTKIQEFINSQKNKGNIKMKEHLYHQIR